MPKPVSWLACRFAYSGHAVREVSPCLSVGGGEKRAREKCRGEKGHSPHYIRGPDHILGRVLNDKVLVLELRALWEPDLGRPGIVEQRNF